MANKSDTAITRLMRAFTHSGSGGGATVPRARLADMRKAKAEVLLTDDQTHVLRDFFRLSRHKD